jgi:SNF2 family DNA or RNA helicase
MEVGLLEKYTREFMQITGAREDQAKYYIVKSRGDIERAMNYYFDEKNRLEAFDALKTQARKSTTQFNLPPNVVPRQPPIADTIEAEESLTTVVCEAPKKTCAFQSLKDGSTERAKLKKLYEEARERYNQNIASSLRNYKYQQNEVQKPQELTGANRLLSYQTKEEEEFDLSAELDDILEFIPTKEYVPPVKAQTIRATETSNRTKMDEETSTDVRSKPLLKKTTLREMVAANQPTTTDSGFPEGTSLFIGGIGATLRWSRAPKLVAVGDLFRGEQCKVKESSVIGKLKLKADDYRRRLIEIRGEDGLLLGYLEDDANLLLFPLLELRVIQVWIHILELPPDLKRLLLESSVEVHVYLLPEAFSAPQYQDFGLSPEAEAQKNRLIGVKQNLVQLILALQMEITKDVITKPLREWAQATSNANSKQSLDLEVVDGDQKIQLFLDRELTAEDISECLEAPDSFSRQLTLLGHQKFALAWLLTREGAIGAQSEKCFESDIHPFWCELLVPLDSQQNSAFRELIQQTKGFREPPSEFFIWFNPNSGQLTCHKPYYSEGMKNFKGGILADEMGLGKTVMMIALLLSNRLACQQVYRVDGSLLDMNASTQQFEETAELMPFNKKLSSNVFLSADHFRLQSKCNNDCRIQETLIVVPTSLVHQWRDEIIKFSSVDIKILVYSEDEKISASERLQDFDVVIVSYSKLSYDYRVNKSKIHDIYWFRIILDEAHYIRNRGTQIARAVAQLNGERRWCLTGTPIQNNMDDIFSLIYFLKYSPWADYNWWNQNINRNLQCPRNKDKAVTLFNAIIKPIMLRRTKQQHKAMLNLPDKTEAIVVVKLNAQEKEKYNNFYLASRKRFQEILESRSLNNCYQFIFAMLTKLRQFCDHQLLSVKKSKHTKNEKIIEQLLARIEKRIQMRNLQKMEQREVEEGPGEGDGASGRVPQKKKKEREAHNNIEFKLASWEQLLGGFYGDDSMDEEKRPNCPICLTSEFENPVVTTCGHFGCGPCMVNWLSSNPTCPFCSLILKKEDLFDLEISSDEYFQKQVNSTAFVPSTKLLALREKTDLVLQNSEKCVIFSHFLGFLELVANSLRKDGIEFVQFDGSLNNKQRSDVLKQFDTDPKISFLLASIKCGGVGLNLIAANHVFLMEPWWNPAFEHQAIDRIYRIGQKKDVFVWRFICEETIEEKIKNIQDEKLELARTTLCQSREQIKNQNLKNIEKLFS